MVPPKFQFLIHIRFVNNEIYNNKGIGSLMGKKFTVSRQTQSEGVLNIKGGLEVISLFVLR